jgi:hypothetical protein
MAVGRASPRERSIRVTAMLALSALAAACGVSDEDGPLAGLTGDCRPAVNELERQRTVHVDITFAGAAGRRVYFTDRPLPPLLAAAVLPPPAGLVPSATPDAEERPELNHVLDPTGRWTGPVDYEHSRVSAILFDDAFAGRPEPAGIAGIARLELAWQHPGQTFERMVASVDVSTVQASARVEGTELVVDLTAPPAWGMVTFAAGAERIAVDIGPDTGDTSAARVAIAAPGQATLRIPVTAFTGAPPAPGTQVDIPLVVRASFRPDLLLAMEGGDDPLPDYGASCDRERRDGPPDRHDFGLWEQLNVYVVANLTVTG